MSCRTVDYFENDIVEFQDRLCRRFEPDVHNCKLCYCLRG